MGKRGCTEGVAHVCAARRDSVALCRAPRGGCERSASPCAVLDSFLGGLGLSGDPLFGMHFGTACEHRTLQWKTKPRAMGMVSSLP